MTRGVQPRIVLGLPFMSVANMITIGSEIYGKNGQGIALVVSMELGSYFTCRRKDIDKIEAAWNNKFPNWQNEAVVTLVYKNPVHIMSVDEVATAVGVEVWDVTDTMFQRLSPLCSELVMPLQAVENGDEMATKGL